MMHALLCNIFVIAANFLVVYGLTNKMEYQLRTNLFSNYSRSSSPPTKGPVKVTCGLAITNLMSMDVQREEISINVWFRMFWTDSRLKWNSSEHGDITQIQVLMEDLWIPDLFLYFATAQSKEFGKSIPGSLKFGATLSNNGALFFSQPTTIYASCESDIANYPFDDQTCKVIIGEWAQDLSQVELGLHRSTGVDLVNYVKHNEWEILSTNASVQVFSDYPASTAGFSKMVIELQLRRNALFYMVNYILPPTVIAILSLLVFLIPPEVGKRMEAGINLLLCLSVYLMLINSKMPITSKSFPLITKFYGTAIVILVISLCCSCWVYGYYFMNPSGWAIYQIPAYLQVFLFDYLHPLLSFSMPCKQRNDKVYPQVKPCLQEDDLQNDIKQSDTKEDASSYNPQKTPKRILYIEIYQKGSEEKGSEDTSAENKINLKEKQGTKKINNEINKKDDDDDDDDDDDEYRDTDSGYSNTSDAGICDVSITDLPPPSRLPKAHNAHLAYMAEAAQIEQQKFQNQEKWKSAAMILNRLFIILLILSIVGAFLGCFMSSARVRLNLY